MRVRTFLAFMAVTLAFPAASAALELIAPTPKALLREGKVQVIGKASSRAEKGKADFQGQSTSFRVKDGVFSVALNLGPGEHEVRFTVGEETLTASWKVDPAAAKGVFAYHGDAQSGACKSCHDEGAPVPSTSDNVAAVCHRCHSTYEKLPFVHGPVAMGLCAACHQPHGSANPNFLRISLDDLCTDCHNQPVTAGHSDYKGAECLKCHKPHGSEKKFFLK